jgi:uncharacterized protein (TIGR03067 family)
MSIKPQSQEAAMSDAVTSANALTGRWVGLYQELDGQIVPHDEVMEFQDNTFKVEKGGNTTYEGTFTVGGATAPFSMALIYSVSAQPIFIGGPRPGIFQVVGNTFKCCFSAIGHPAPGTLNTYPGSGSVLTVFERRPAAAHPQLLASTKLLGSLPW